MASQGLRAARLPDDLELLPRAREAALALVEALPFREEGAVVDDNTDALSSSSVMAVWPRSLARAVEDFEARTTALSAAAEAALGSRKNAAAAAAAGAAPSALAALEEPKKRGRKASSSPSAAKKKAPAAAAGEAGAAEAPRRGRPRKSAQQ